MSASYPTKMLLAFRSGDWCAFPGCSRNLTIDATPSSDPVVTGVAAHIAGEHSTAARYDSTMTDPQRDHYNNLIYLCGDHHTQIDKQEKAFPVAMLLNMKAKHEATVRESDRTVRWEIGRRANLRWRRLPPRGQGGKKD
jgi:HNH endonuclease